MMATDRNRCIARRPDIRPSRAVCRRLFPEEDIDHVEIKKTLERTNMLIDERNKLNWNFDFLHERPLPGKYDWEPVVTDCDDGVNTGVPTAYEMPALFANVRMLSALKPVAQKAACLEHSAQEESRVPELFTPEVRTPVNMKSSSRLSSPTTPPSTTCMNRNNTHAPASMVHSPDTLPTTPAEYFTYPSASEIASTQDRGEERVSGDLPAVATSSSDSSTPLARPELSKKRKHTPLITDYYQEKKKTHTECSSQKH